MPEKQSFISAEMTKKTEPQTSPKSIFGVEKSMFHTALIAAAGLGYLASNEFNTQFSSKALPIESNSSNSNEYDNLEKGRMFLRRVLEEVVPKMKNAISDLKISVEKTSQDDPMSLVGCEKKAQDLDRKYVDLSVFLTELELGSADKSDLSLEAGKQRKSDLKWCLQKNELQNASRVQEVELARLQKELRKIGEDIAGLRSQIGGSSKKNSHAEKQADFRIM